jgi:hypothetical protein
MTCDTTLFCTREEMRLHTLYPLSTQVLNLSPNIGNSAMPCIMPWERDQDWGISRGKHTKQERDLSQEL